MPRYLRALRLDREHMVASETGSVVRVFGRAAHLRSTGGSLIFLAAKDLADGPRGIRLETPGGFSFRNGLRAGDPYAIRGGLAASRPRRTEDRSLNGGRVAAR